MFRSLSIGPGSEGITLKVPIGWLVVFAKNDSITFQPFQWLFFCDLSVLVTASYPVISPRISQSTRAGDWLASIVWISSGR